MREKKKNECLLSYVAKVSTIGAHGKTVET
jgi:hypothetical protein